MSRCGRYLLSAGALVSLLVSLPAPSIGFAAPAADKLVLAISPVRYEVSVTPGSSTTCTATVTNAGSMKVRIASQFQDFIAQDESGRPLLVTNSRSPWSMSNWIKVTPASFTLKPSQTATVTVTIRAPKDAEPGGHYAAALFGTVPDNTKASSVSAKVGLLLLATVAGNITEAGTASLKAPWLSEPGAIPLTLRFENSGNIHVRPTTTVRVFRLWGNQITELPVDGENVLPKSARVMQARWQEAGIGLYEADASVTFGQGKRTATERVRFIVAPWKSILFGLGLFIAGVLTTLLLMRKKAGGRASTSDQSPATSEEPLPTEGTAQLPQQV